MPIISHSTLPLSQPQASSNLLSNSIDLLIPNITYKWNHTTVLCDWLLSFSIMFHLVHIIAYISTSLLFVAILIF